MGARKVASQPMPSGTLWMLAAYIIFIAMFGVGVCWLWPDFVDGAEVPRVRNALYLGLAIQVLIEVCICLGSALKWWVIWFVLITDAWGMLDALLRFPFSHEVDTPFGFKQLLLLVLRIVGYGFGFKDLGRHVGWYILLMMACIFTLPIMWLAALPVDDPVHDATDEDIVFRLWRLRKPQARAELAVRCQASARKAAAWLVHVMPFLQPVASKLDPSLARAMKNQRAI